MDFPFDCKRGLKSLWAESAQGKMPSLEACKAIAAKNPYRNGEPLSEVLAYLALKNRGQTAPPLALQFILMPVAELCQLVLLWACAGEPEAAAALAHSIPLDFPWLWCRENEYREEEALASIALLSRSLGHHAEEFSGGDPYFQTLAKHLSRLAPCQSTDPVLDWSLIETEEIKCCFTFSGSRTSIGALVADAAEIRAFGPQAFPLSDPLGFGIRSTAQRGNQWASPSASPEIWFETKGRREGAGIVFDLAFFGLKPSEPLAFSFYVKSDSAQIGSEKLKPKTLQRYQGISKPIEFGGSLCIESLTPGKMEVIPLAGGGGYWNCEYLAAFEIHPVNAKMAFSIFKK